jgi:hypothetical protein
VRTSVNFCPVNQFGQSWALGIPLSHTGAPAPAPIAASARTVVTSGPSWPLIRPVGDWRKPSIPRTLAEESLHRSEVTVTRFMNAAGVEVSLSSPDALVAAVRDGAIGPTTLVYDEPNHRWKPASEWAPYQAATALVDSFRPTAGSGARTGAPPAETPEAPPRRSVNPDPGRRPVDGGWDGAWAPRHGLRGKLYVGFAYLGAAGMGLTTLILTGATAADGEPAFALLMLLILGGIAVGVFFLARGVWRFSETARVFALVLTYISIAAAVIGILFPEDGPSALGALFSLPVNLAFVHYFHTRRDDFRNPGRRP